MKNKLFASLVILSLPVWAQIEGTPPFNPMDIDHLEPISNYGWVDIDSEIFTDIELFNNGDFVITQHYQHSRCQSHFLVSLFGTNNHPNSFNIAYTLASKPLDKAKKIGIKTKFKTVLPETAGLVQSMYEEVLIQTRYAPNPEAVWLLDCANTHHFHGEGPKYQPMHGGSVSPKSGTPPAELVKASEHMIAYVKGEIDEMTLVELINQSINSIKTYAQ